MISLFNASIVSLATLSLSLISFNCWPKFLFCILFCSVSFLTSPSALVALASSLSTFSFSVFNSLALVWSSAWIALIEVSFSSKDFSNFCFSAAFVSPDFCISFVSSSRSLMAVVSSFCFDSNPRLRVAISFWDAVKAFVTRSTSVESLWTSVPRSAFSVLALPSAPSISARHLLVSSNSNRNASLSFWAKTELLFNFSYSNCCAFSATFEGNTFFEISSTLSLASSRSFVSSFILSRLIFFSSSNFFKAGLFSFNFLVCSSSCFIFAWASSKAFCFVSKARCAAL